MLKPVPHPSGYFIITLYSRAAGHKTGRIHRLVADAFVTREPHQSIVHHINRIKTDNRAENLQWMNGRAHSTMTARTGHYKHGEEHHKSKLKAKEVKSIKSRLGKVAVKKLAREFGVSPSTIHDIQKGRTWNTKRWAFEFENGDGI